LALALAMVTGRMCDRLVPIRLALRDCPGDGLPFWAGPLGVNPWPMPSSA